MSIPGRDGLKCTQRAYFSVARDADVGDPPYTPSQLDQLDFDPDRIRDACHLLGLQAGITVVIEMEGYRDEDGDALVSTAAISYSATTIQRLARLGLAIDHDQYVEIHS